jgi:hypothetical protein
LLLLVPAAGFGDSIEQLEGSGLVVKSDPPEATVYLDGISQGVTPLTFPSLPAGTYAIRLTKEGCLDRELTVTIPREGRLSVSLNMERANGSLLIRTRRAPGSPGETAFPLNPQVYVDGERKTGTSLILAEGNHTITIRAFGWEDFHAVVYIRRGRNSVLNAAFSPAPFSISAVRVQRPRFNPANPGSLGSTELSFTVSAPGRGTLTVREQGGRTVYQKELGPFTNWSQSVSWDGRTQEGAALPDGSYTLHIEAQSSVPGGAEAVRQSAGLETVLDSTLYIEPFQLSAAASGLSWAPGAELLPLHSWQLESSLLFGKPLLEEGWNSLPFAAAVSVNVFERFELGAAVNIVPRFGENAPLSPGLSAKWGILKPGEASPAGWTALALGFRYGFSARNEISPFGLPGGPEIFLPLSVSLNRAFALLLVPALWWPGEEGIPESARPYGVLSGGLIFRRPSLNAALSARTETAFGSAPFERTMLGGELKFFPSVLVFTLLGGVWFENTRMGFYGGIGIGMIN